MNIAILNAYQGGVERGAETFVEELSKRLMLKHSVDILTEQAQPLPRWKLLWRVYLDPPGLFILWFTFKNIIKIARKRYDVVIPLNGGWQPALIRVVTWFYGGKMIISGQSGPGWDDINNIWCLPDFFIALSSYSARWAKKINPYIKIVTIPNGVDLDKFKPGKRNIQLNLKRPRILCVAALTDTKRIDLAIGAVAKINNASLLVVGKGERHNYLKQIGKKTLQDRFEIKSYPYSIMPDVYRACDLFTIPSLPFHSFEIVILEAMASNLPVVVNKDPIREEIVGTSGLLVNPEDQDEYAAKLTSALHKNWNGIPRKQAEKFSWDMVTARYEDLFGKLN